jgi:hypothetical protein
MPACGPIDLHERAVRPRSTARSRRPWWPTRRRARARRRGRTSAGDLPVDQLQRLDPWRATRAERGPGPTRWSITRLPVGVAGGARPVLAPAASDVLQGSGRAERDPLVVELVGDQLPAARRARRPGWPPAPARRRRRSATGTHAGDGGHRACRRSPARRPSTRNIDRPLWRLASGSVRAGQPERSRRTGSALVHIFWPLIDVLVAVARRPWWCSDARSVPEPRARSSRSRSASRRPEDLRQAGTPRAARRCRSCISVGPTVLMREERDRHADDGWPRR